MDKILFSGKVALGKSEPKAVAKSRHREAKTNRHCPMISAIISCERGHTDDRVSLREQLLFTPQLPCFSSA